MLNFLILWFLLVFYPQFCQALAAPLIGSSGDGEQSSTESSTATTTTVKLAITAPGIAARAGVTVTQDGATGTLKTALVNEWILDIINAPDLDEIAGAIVSQGFSVGKKKQLSIMQETYTCTAIHVMGRS